MFSARNLDLSEVSLNTSRELEAYIIIKPEYMKYIIDLCVIYDANACRLQLIDNDESSIRISNPASRLLIEMLTHPNIPLKREMLIKRYGKSMVFRLIDQPQRGRQ